MPRRKTSGAVTRFAPSPTGYLHLGHAFAALTAHDAARGQGGKFLLRIEDIDPGRCKPEFAKAIFEDLAWLGLEWEMPVRYQSKHLDDYAAALAKLERRGLVYPCFCTRADIKAEIEKSGSAPHGPDGPVYPGLCKKISVEERESFALRLDMEMAASAIGPVTFRDRNHGLVKAAPAKFGDIVLARKDVATSYHLAATVDDNLQGVTLVTRGADLFEATHVHRLLQALLGYHTPEYQHHRIVTDQAGRRLAKRDSDLSIRGLREAKYTPHEVRSMCGFEPQSYAAA
jgi:glutamyl-Q tRNA(Asp) synthetase